MKNKKVLLITLATIVSLGALAFFANNQPINEKKESDNSSISLNPTEENKEKTLTKEELAKEKEKKEIDLVNEAVIKNIGPYKDNVAVYYQNLVTGTEYTLNPDKEFTGASVRKLGNVMAAADLIQAGSLDPNSLISYNPKTDYEGGTGILQNQSTIKPITVEKAIELAIVHSDNIATRMLSKVSGGTSKSIEKVTGIPTPSRTLTARQASIMLNKLYTNVDNNQIYTDIIEHLKNTVFHDRMDKHLPYNEVAHKIGTYEGYYHDAGIVYSDNADDYILVVMTNNIGVDPTTLSPEDKAIIKDNYNAGCETIANISKDVYDGLNELGKN